MDTIETLVVGASFDHNDVARHPAFYRPRISDRNVFRVHPALRVENVVIVFWGVAWQREQDRSGDNGYSARRPSAFCPRDFSLAISDGNVGVVWTDPARPGIWTGRTAGLYGMNDIPYDGSATFGGLIVSGSARRNHCLFQFTGGADSFTRRR